MLKQRLIFGTLMVLFFVGIMVLDGWLDGSLTSSSPNAPIQGTLLCILIVLLVIAGQLELAGMVEKAREFRDEGTEIYHRRQ